MVRNNSLFTRPIEPNPQDSEQEEDSYDDHLEMSSLQQQFHNEDLPLLSGSSTETGSVEEERIKITGRENIMHEELILHAVDKIEDELDLPYEDLVPLEVKLALEDKVFGWSHLSSDILGHVGFTLGAYIFVYVLISQVLHHWTLDHWSFRAARFMLSVWSGLSAFRMVRRRKRVWLRAAYGSKDYAKDADRRRKFVQESDRTTILGRIRKGRERRAERKHQRKLMKASQRFSNRHLRHQSSLKESLGPPSSPRISHLSNKTDENQEATDTKITSEVAESSSGTPSKIKRRTRSFHAFPTEETRSIGHDQVSVKNGPIKMVPYAHGAFFGAAPFMLANPHWIDVLRLLMPDVYIEISRRVLHAPAPKLIHWAENNPVVAAFGTAHELENNSRVFNIEWDVFLDPLLVHRVDVVLREQEKFMRSCVPDELKGLSGKALRDEVMESITLPHISTTKRLNLTSSQRSILQYYDKELHERTQVLVDRMLIAHGNLTQLALEQTGYAKFYNFSRVKRTRRTLGGGMYARQWLAVYAEALKLGLCLDSDSEDDGRDELRHAKSFNASVPLTPNSSADEIDIGTTHQSTCECLQCLASELGQSSESALAASSQDDRDCIFRPKGKLRRSNTEGSPTRQRSRSPDVVSSSRGLNTTMAESIRLLKSISRCPDPVGIVFDVKSRHTPKQVWGVIVDALRDAGARVEGVGSFIEDDVREISKHSSAPVNEILFFHSAGDLQSACHNGQIRNGDTVFFNAGSLLWEKDVTIGTTTVLINSVRSCLASFDPEEVKRNYQILPFARAAADKNEPNGQEESNETDRALSTLQQYKEKFDLSIGLYCQEFSIDEAAVNILVEHVNSNSHIYDLGLSWGGVNGLTLCSIQPGRFTSTDGFWNQRYAGKPWDSMQSPANLQ